MISQRLKELRGKKTQNEVADAIDGLSREKLSHYETGRTEPDLEMLVKFANYYKVSTEYLLGRTETPHPVHTESRFVSLQALIEMRDRLRRGERGDIPETRATNLENYLSFEIERILDELDE